MDANVVSSQPQTEDVREIGQLIWLEEFTGQLMNVRTVQQALELTARSVLRAMDGHSVTIYLADCDGALELRYGVNRQGQSILDEPPTQIDHLAELIHHVNAPIWITGHEPDAVDKVGGFLTKRGVAALIGIPLAHDKSSPMNGVLWIRFDAPRQFPALQVQLLNLYASQADGMLEWLRVAEEARQRDADLGIVMETVHMMISTLNLDELLQQVAVRLAWVSGSDECSISTYEAKPERVRTLAHYTVLGVPVTTDLGEEYLLADYPATARLMQGSEPLVIRLGDPQADPAETAFLQHWGFSTVLMFSLKVAGQPIGLVELYSKKPNLRITALSLRRMHLLSEQVALALVNARLYHGEHEQRNLAEALREISLALSSSLKASSILEILLEQIGKVVPYDTGCVMLVEEESIRIACQRGYDLTTHESDPIDFQIPLDDMPTFKEMAETLRPLVIRDVPTATQWRSLGLWSDRIGSWVGAPLVVRDRLMGFLSLDKTERGFYTSEHAARLQSLAGHAALALLNALTFGEVEQASITDFLTGCYNHRYFQQQLRAELERAQQLGIPVSLLMLDLDHFKRVNDTYGHLGGDMVLRQLAQRLKAELRSIDFLARYGGEEFAVILPGTPIGALGQVAQRLLQAVSGRLFSVESQQIPITVSIGGSTFPIHAQGARDLVGCADQALYRAKNTGRNRVCLNES